MASIAAMFSATVLERVMRLKNVALLTERWLAIELPN